MAEGFEQGAAIVAAVRIENDVVRRLGAFAAKTRQFDLHAGRRAAVPRVERMRAEASHCVPFVD
jgi:hypothetical protein